MDDEMISVITDIEGNIQKFSSLSLIEPLLFSIPDDDMSGLTGYHSALPLEVHGSGYAQMQMVSNSKAERLVSFKV